MWKGGPSRCARCATAPAWQSHRTLCTSCEALLWAHWHGYRRNAGLLKLAQPARALLTVASRGELAVGTWGGTPPETVVVAFGLGLRGSSHEILRQLVDGPEMACPDLDTDTATRLCGQPTYSGSPWCGRHAAFRALAGTPAPRRPRGTYMSQ